MIDLLTNVNGLTTTKTSPSVKEVVVVPSDEIKTLALELGLSDDLTANNNLQPRGAKRIKQVLNGPRKPYRKYQTFNGTFIKVGKNAKDNDVLTVSGRRETAEYWWLHSQGCSGSHVILCSDRSYKELVKEEEMKDAAFLTAKYSKFGNAGNSKIKVSVARCRDVVKPPFVADGMVVLKKVEDVLVVDMNSEEV